MIRRFSAALIGLALCLPIFAIAPVAAHTNGGLAVEVSDTWTDAAGTHVVGKVTNHTSSRRSPVVVTATFEMGTVDETQAATAFMSNLAPHATTGFHILETADVTGNTGVSLFVSGSITGTKPAGGLHVEQTSFVGDVLTVSVTNDSGLALTGVRASAHRSGGANDDAAESPAADLGIGATASYVITFDDDSDGATATAISARSASGNAVSWNHYFGDLGTTTFTTEIAFLADEGITLGCGNANFCPTNSVTRTEMAIFLDRALGLPDDVDGTPFTDIGGLSAEAQQAIANIHNAGITGGCTATTYCPSQTVTRGQMSKFIVLGYGLPDASGGFIDSFTDDDGHFSEPFNDSMKQAGITSGCTATTYCPNSNVKRDQMARFLFVAENP